MPEKAKHIEVWEKLIEEYINPNLENPSCFDSDKFIKQVQGKFSIMENTEAPPDRTPVSIIRES